ncbi:galactose-specific lectin nattectin-like [Cottoperca gobio]|uniref:Galactose-specific lectin nattectin-like n=1 Tax=Cottoperca gobio TaxID=56716 RepID=A0A6J2Q261_COTGO|nr:galactose-specific lectin nattectin-like [Cottoperca gobio]
MASALHCIVLFCLTSGLWMEANATCPLKRGRCEACPAGWTQFCSRCFMFNHEEKDWADAETSCIASGGNLASVKTANEYTFIRELVKRAAGSDKTSWIGGYDAVKEGLWEWSDGSKFDFKSWGKKESNNMKKQENCMEINFKGRDYVNDSSCSLKRSFVCSTDPSPIPI